MFYFFKELQVFLFLLIRFFIFCVSFFKRMNSMACLLSVFINSFFIFCVSFYKRINSMAFLLSVFINAFFIFCVSFCKRMNSVACLLSVFVNSFFIFCVSFYERINSMACLPAPQTPTHQTLNILMLLTTTYNKSRLFRGTISFKLLLFWFFYL